MLQAAPQTPKCVHLKLCAANRCQYYPFLLLGEIMSTSLERQEGQEHATQAGVDVQLQKERVLSLLL